MKGRVGHMAQQEHQEHQEHQEQKHRTTNIGYSTVQYGMSCQDVFMNLYEFV